MAVMLLRLLLAAYAGLVVYWLLFSFGRSISFTGPLRYNLQPLETLRLFMHFGSGLSLTDRLVNLLGNVAVFVPFGLLLPLCFRRARTWYGAGMLFIPCIMLLELIQMLTRAGSFDVDDLILNTAGMWAGYAWLRIIRH